MTRIKICGLRDARLALMAAHNGADYLGFVFVPGVRRCLALDEAQRIVANYREAHSRKEPFLVGLFSDQPLAAVNNILEIVGLDMAQLCGEESSEYITQVIRPAIKVVHVADGATPEVEVARVAERLRVLRKAGVIATLDRKSAVQPGGLGRPFNWTIAEKLSTEHDFLLAGGLTPANVAGAIATVRPWGVDVSSGVERDGVKDTAKIKAFIAAARATGT